MSDIEGSLIFQLPDEKKKKIPTIFMRICDWVERNLISHRGTDCSYLPFPKQEGIHTQRELGYKLGKFFLLFPGHSLLIGFDSLGNK